MDTLLNESRFDFLSADDRAYILAFDREMARLGYDFGGKIGSGYCWGKYMLIYRKTGVKSENVYARIYMRDTSILLRLFLSNIDKHRLFIEKAPAHIKGVFVGGTGDCTHDRSDEVGNCKFRKTYTIDGRLIEKCNGITFEFYNPSVEKLADYIALVHGVLPGKEGTCSSLIKGQSANRKDLRRNAKERAFNLFPLRMQFNASLQCIFFF